MTPITPERVDLNLKVSDQWMPHAEKVGFIQPCWDDATIDYPAEIDLTEDESAATTIGTMVIGLLSAGYRLDPWTFRHLHREDRWVLVFSNAADAVTARMVS